MYVCICVCVCVCVVVCGLPSFFPPSIFLFHNVCANYHAPLQPAATLAEEEAVATPEVSQCFFRPLTQSHLCTESSRDSHPFYFRHLFSGSGAYRALTTQWMGGAGGGSFMSGISSSTTSVASDYELDGYVLIENITTPTTLANFAVSSCAQAGSRGPTDTMCRTLYSAADPFNMFNGVTAAGVQKVRVSCLFMLGVGVCVCVCVCVCVYV